MYEPEASGTTLQPKCAARRSHSDTVARLTYQGSAVTSLLWERACGFEAYR